MTATTTDPTSALDLPGAVPRFAWPLPPDPTAGMYARRLLQSVCAVLAMPGEQADGIVLMASELAANAIEHAPGPYEIRLYHPGDTLVCEVVNSGHQMFPLPAEATREWTLDDIDAAADLDALERGRGLSTVSALSQGRCGVRPTTLHSPGRTLPGIAAWFAIDTTANPSKE